jgi:hypothetical protein
LIDTVLCALISFSFHLFFLLAAFLNKPLVMYFYISLPLSNKILPSNLSVFQLSHGPDQWAKEFAAEREQSGPVDEQWVNEFSKLHVNDWADEFGRQVGEGAFGESSADNWADAYDE